MGQGRFSEQQIATILEAHKNGASAEELARQHGMSTSTLYRWKARHQGVSSTEEALVYVSGLQQVLVEVSRIFMEAEFGQLDDQITHTLSRIGEYCDVDRAYLFRFKNDRQLMDNTHEWCAPGITPEMDSLQNLPRDAVPNVMRLMEQHQVMRVSRVADLGEGWENDRAIFEEEDIQSLVVVPIVVENRLVGFIGFDSVRRQRDWLDEEVRLLAMSGDLIGAALKRDEVERALHASKNLLDETEQLSRVGSWEWNIPGGTFHISDTFLKLQGVDDTGLNREQLLEKFVHPDDLPEVKKRISEAMETGKPYHFSYRIIRGNTGEIRWVDSHARFYYENGKPVLARGFMQDITEKMLAEKALVESEKRHRTLVENVREIVFDLDTQSRWVFLNPAWEQITGFSVAEALGKRSIDYIYEKDKPLNRREFEAMLRGKQAFCRHEIRFVRRDGSPGWVEVHAQLRRDEQGNYVGVSGTLRDVTLQRQAEEKLIRMAQYDALTDLPNRALALDRLSQHLLTAQRRGESVAVLFVDIDHFKKVNDSLGHDTGDKLLIAAAKRLLDVVRKQDTVARLGGDEFLIMLSGINQHADIQNILEKLLRRFHQPFTVQGRKLVLTASIGVAVAPDDGELPQDLLRHADMAMYKSKTAGRNTYHFFTDSMNREMARRVAIEDALRQALKQNELTPVFQPLVELSSGRIVGAEVLLRWHSQSLGAVSPMDFIPVAEQTGMIEPIGDFVMQQAFHQAADWRKILGGDFYISVNVSPHQFRDPDMPGRLQDLCNKYALSTKAVVVEITEGVLLSNQQHVMQTLDALRQRGVRIAMDDFGTGYASLSYLREYPFDILKIDRSFVGDCTNDTKDAELVTASLRLATGLGLQAIAEGVETEAQLTFLRDNGCPVAQGYLFSRPVEAEAMDKLVASGLPIKVFPDAG